MNKEEILAKLAAGELKVEMSAHDTKRKSSSGVKATLVGVRNAAEVERAIR